MPTTCFIWGPREQTYARSPRIEPCNATLFFPPCSLTGWTWVKPKPKPIPKFVKMACYQATAYFIYNIMGLACISVPIRKKQIQMYTNTQTLWYLLHDSLSFVLLLYMFWQILPQNYPGITDCIYLVTFLTKLFVSIRSSNTQKQRSRLYCSETAGFQPSFPPLPLQFIFGLDFYFFFKPPA